MLKKHRNSSPRHLNPTTPLEINLRNILDGVTESVVLVDCDFRIIDFNSQAYERIIRNSQKEIKIGSDFREYVFSEHKERFIKAFKKSIKGEVSYLEAESGGPNNKNWLECKICPCYNKNKHIVGATVVVRDINNKKKAEFTLLENQNTIKRSETLIKAILDNTSDCIILMDKNYSVLAFNRMMKNTLQLYFKKQITIGADYRDFVIEPLKTTFLRAFARALKGYEFIEDIETPGVNENIWFQYHISPVYHSSGELLGVSLTAQNIHQRKKTEIALKISEEKFKKIIEFSTIPLLLIHEGMGINYANSAAVELFGYSREEFQQINIRRLMEPKPSSKILSTKKPSIRFSSFNTGKVHVFYTKYGISVLTETASNVIEIDSVNYAILSLQNVTNRVKSELQLIKYNRELTLLTKINDIILHSKNETRLYSTICDCLISIGKYELSWICLTDTSDEFVQPLASSGVTEYLKGLKISLKNPVHANGPTAKALTKGKTMVTNNINASKQFSPWLERAKQYNISASCVVPLIINKKVIGALNIYSSNTNSFDRDEIKILQRISNNISLAINNFRTKEEKDKATIQLNARIHELRTIYQISTLLKDESKNLSEVLSSMVNIIPSGWKHPKFCQARISFASEVFTSKNYSKPKLKQVFQRKTNDGKTFLLEVSYKRLIEKKSDGFFLKEEELLTAIGELFILYYNKQAIFSALQKSESNLKYVVNNTSVGHLLLDKDCRIITFNETMGYAYPLLSGLKLSANQSFIESVIPERRGLLHAIFQEVTSSKQPYNYEVTFEYNGETMYFSTSIVPVLESEEVIGYSMSVYDISKIKRMEIERDKIISELSQRNRDLEQFSYIVSHNIRSPLATLLGFSNLLKLNLSDEEKAKVYLGLDDSANKLDQSIKDVNEILNVKKGLLQAKTEINLNQIMSSVLGSLDDAIKSSGSQISYDFSQVARIQSIRPYLHSIFYNLILNAIKYAKTNEPPVISVWSIKAEGMVNLFFKDNGIGIDLEKYGDQIFGLYKKFNLAVEGKGMGLFMVKTQVNALNGYIDVQSHLNEGSVFTVTLPL